MYAQNLLATGLVAFATVSARAQTSNPPRQPTPMPETTTQAPAPVVRHTSKATSPQEIVPNPDGSLPRTVHANEYHDSYVVPRTATPKPAPQRQVLTANPLTSLTSQGTPTPLKAPSVSKPVTVTAPPKAKAIAVIPAAKPAAKPDTSAAAKPSIAQAITQLPPGPFNRTVIVIDPSHGGTDAGSRITDSISEKDVDLQFSFKLRSLLSARGFTVVLTRDSDTATLPDKPDSPLTLDARAGIANRQQAVACLLVHATGSGHGAHLYTSELTSVPAEPYAAPWLTAQNGWVTQSLALQKQIGRALTRASIPLVLSRASVRPVDSLTCPALVIELAPDGNSASSINDDGYQQRVANAIATALIFWQNSAQPPARLPPPVYKAPPPVVKPAVDATTTAAPAIPPAVQP